jgi:DHA2 family multidrug resistance protein
MRKTNRYVIALVVALGMIPIVLDSTIVNVSLTSIRTALGTDVDTVQWIFTGYLLANAAFVAIGGYLANRFGRKRIFIFGIALFTLGSLLCALAPTIGWLIGFRVLQGIGGGILLPVGPAVAFDAFPQEERARASAAIAVPILLGPVFGPILGGYLNDTFGWHSIFTVNLPVGVLAIGAALLALPGDESGAARNRVRFDAIGLALSMLGIVAVIYALSLVTRTNPATVTAANPAGDLYGWGYWLVWVLLGGGGVVLVLFAVQSLFLSRSPALDLRQLKRHDFLMSNILTWAASLFSFGLLLLLPIYFESVHQPPLSALDTGLALIPFGVGSLVGTVASAVLYRLLGPRWVAALGAALNAFAAWLLARTIVPTADAGQMVAALRNGTAIPATAGADAVWWGLFAVGLSFTFIQIPTQTLALEALKGEALDKASSLLISTKLIFQSIGVAILTTIFVNLTRSRATDLAQQLRALLPGAGINPGDPAALAALRAVEAQIGTQAGTFAVQSIFWLISFTSLGLVVLALLLPGRRRDAKAASDAAKGAATASAEVPAAPAQV